MRTWLRQDALLLGLALLSACSQPSATLDPISEEGQLPDASPSDAGAQGPALRDAASADRDSQVERSDTSVPVSDASAAEGRDASGPSLAPRAGSRSARLRQTLGELAAFGEKRAGTPGGEAAGRYVAARLQAAGLAVARDEFQFPYYELISSTLSVELEGKTESPVHEVFAYGGAGSFDAQLVCVGGGTALDFALSDPRGKVVLVERNPTFHRTAQYALIAERGGMAMIYVSAAPDDLIQTGAVRMAQEGLGPIPALTVTASVGKRLKDACGRGVRVRGKVDARVRSGTATNVVAVHAGATADAPRVLIGAHYDTWHVGAADNGAGVAALLELADTLAMAPAGRLATAFAAYDAEEVGLLGGYDYLRKHLVRDHEPVVAYLHFEGPAVSPQGGNKLLTYTGGAGLVDSIEATGSRSLYPLTIGLELVPLVVGGIIPTDVQGLYRYGVQGIATACDTPWYHTPADTPDKIDVDALTNVVTHFEALRADLDKRLVGTAVVRDPALWNLRVMTRETADGLSLDIAVQDGAHAAVSGANVKAWLGVDDFTEAWRGNATSTADGSATLSLPRVALGVGKGSRFLHVTAGNAYPLAELIVALP